MNETMTPGYRPDAVGPTELLQNELDRALIEYGQQLQYMSESGQLTRFDWKTLDRLTDTIVTATGTLRGNDAGVAMAEMLRSY